MKHFFYLQKFKNTIDNFILYDTEKEIVYDFYKDYTGKFFKKHVISNSIHAEEYELLILDYSSSDIIAITKEKFEELKKIDLKDLENFDYFINKYCLYEWLI